MGIGTELNFVIPDEGLNDETVAARILPSIFITFSGSGIGDDAKIGDIVGTLAVTAAYQGTPVWELVDDASGSFTVNPSTGVVRVAKALTAGDVSIKAKARGIRPQIFSPTFAIVVSHGGGGGYVGPLDLVAGAIVAYGQRALSATMRGQPLYTLRRGSDNAEQTFNSDAATGEPPVSDITTWLGGAGFVKTWFDQSGNGHDVMQADPVKQFLWAAVSANGKPCFSAVVNDGKFLASSAPVSFPNGAFTIVSVQKITDDFASSILGADTNGGGPDFNYRIANLFNGQLYRIAAYADAIAYAAGNGFQGNVAPLSNTYTVVDIAWDTTTDSGNVNGTAVGGISDFNYGGGNSGVCNELIAVGSSGATVPGDYLVGELSEIIAYTTIKSGGDRTLLRGNEATYYGITLPGG